MGAPIEGACVVAGGGPVGATLALALSQAGVPVVLIDEGGAGMPSGPDDRSYALTPSSTTILQSLGVWSEVEPQATAIVSLHVTDAGRFGYARIDAATLACPALGHVVPAHALAAALARATGGVPSLTVLRPARVDAVHIDAAQSRVEYRTADGAGTARAPLLVGADGMNSPVREAAGIDTEVQDYGHDAIVTTVAVERDHAGVAYERFTREGPFALLPRAIRRCGLVWTVARSRLPALLALDDAAFCAEAQSRFGARLGRFTEPGSRAAYPLRALRARERIAPRTILLGNAAQTMHPTAAQGLNLGLRDAAAVAEYVVGCRRGARDPGKSEALAAFARCRDGDHCRSGRLSDGLARLFSNDLPVLTCARNCGLSLFNLVAPAQRAFLRAAGGLSGSVPRLARGLPL
jgi:2-octaprenyl-6-methoxyphenol hydroxylase